MGRLLRRDGDGELLPVMLNQHQGCATQYHREVFDNSFESLF